MDSPTSLREASKPQCVNKEQSTHLQPDVEEEKNNADLRQRLGGVDMLHKAEAMGADDDASNQVPKQRRLCTRCWNSVRRAQELPLWT